MHKWMMLIALLFSFQSNAALEQLDNAALEQVQGQAGADISLKVTLNQTSTGQFDENLCIDRQYCRLAVAFNNRGTEAMGNRQWLVFKGIQGTINIQKLGLDGVDLIYNNKANVQIVKPAIQLGSRYESPILLRNFGFDTLSIETDTGVGAANAGYLVNGSGGIANVNSYVNGKYTVDGYDKGREVGFTGIKLNGNLAMNAKLMIFSCDASHPRC